MNIKKITLYLIEQPLLAPFSSSLETVHNRESIIVEMEEENGVAGWGEVVAFSSPWYTEETIKTSWHMLEDFLIREVFAGPIKHPQELKERFLLYKRNNMAKASLDMAIYDLFAKIQGISLSKLIGGSKDFIPSGVVVGIGSMEDVLGKINTFIKQGYKRIKVKIKPGEDYDVIKKIRDVFPNLPLMADANSAYTLNDLDLLKRLDEFELMMIEQPLASDDIVDHAIAQKELNTPVCLDESIVTFDDARRAIQLGSCRVINIKIGRVGGITEAIAIHDLCYQNGISVWCGGMLETGISRAHNIALASLANFSFPGDISASSRYWKEDIVTPEVKVEDGLIAVPTCKGMGFEINIKRLNAITKEKKVFLNEN